MAQTQRPRGSTDLPPDPKSPLVQSPSGPYLHMGALHNVIYIGRPSEFILSIQPGQDGVEPLVLLTQDVQRLRFLLAECKKFKEIAGVFDFSCDFV